MEEVAEWGSGKVHGGAWWGRRALWLGGGGLGHGGRGTGSQPVPRQPGFGLSWERNVRGSSAGDAAARVIHQLDPPPIRLRIDGFVAVAREERLRRRRHIHVTQLTGRVR